MTILEFFTFNINCYYKMLIGDCWVLIGYFSMLVDYLDVVW